MKTFLVLVISLVSLVVSAASSACQLPPGGAAQPMAPAALSQENPAVTVVELSPRSQRELELEEFLDQSALEFNYDSVTFQQVMFDLKAKLGLELVLDISASEGDLPKETPITMSMGEVPLRLGLSRMLEVQNATIQIEDSCLKIISLDVESDPKHFRRRSYDVDNLIHLLIGTEPLVGERRAKPRSPGGMFQVPTGQGLATQPTSNSQNAPTVAVQMPPPEVDYEEISPQQQAREKLIESIQTHIEPGSWADKGQGAGTITIVGNVLTVSQSESNLSQIKSYLLDLEHHLGSIAAR